MIGDVDFTAGHAIRYAYDARGNILTKSTYPNTSGTGTPTVVNCGYTDSSWKDLLTGYNGTALTYDEAGNPLTWRDGMTFT